MARFELLLVGVPRESRDSLRDKLRGVPTRIDRDALLRAAWKEPFTDTVVFETNRHYEAQRAQDALHELGCKTVICESERLTDRLSGAFVALSDAAARRFGNSG